MQSSSNVKESIITQDEYVSLKLGYFEQATELSQQITALKDELQSLETREAVQNEWIVRFKQYRNIDSLNRQLVTDLIDVIYVYEGRRIMINFKFQDEFERVIAFANQEAGSLEMAV